MCFVNKGLKGATVSWCSGGGNGLCLLILLIVIVWESTIGDVREGSDEEHSIWSGGSKIKDLAQCGWGEIKDEKRKREKND